MVIGTTSFKKCGSRLFSLSCFLCINHMKSIQDVPKTNGSEAEAWVKGETLRPRLWYVIKIQFIDSAVKEVPRSSKVIVKSSTKFLKAC